MSAEENWGPWIEHDGKLAPYLAGRWIEGDIENAIFIAGAVIPADVERIEWRVETGLGESWDWSNWPEYSRILRYRIRKPRGLTILENLIADLPVPVREGVDA